MALQHRKPCPQNPPRQPRRPCLTSTYHKKKKKKVTRGNGNRGFESRLGDTEPGPCCHRGLQVTSASHSISAPSSITPQLKTNQPHPKEKREPPGSGKASSPGEGHWGGGVLPKFPPWSPRALTPRVQSPVRTEPPLPGFSLRFSRPPAREEESWTPRERGRGRSGAASGCSAFPARRRQHSMSRLGSSEHFWECGDHSLFRIITEKFQPGVGRGGLG